MSIDYVIDWDCEPKAALTTPGILARLKARDRAEAIIQLYRERGDRRPPAEMGFELARRTPDGNEETQVVIVQDLLDQATPLDPLAAHCAACPANAAGRAFGCFGAINYPLTRAAEWWLLQHLPTVDEPLPYLLLGQALQDSPGLGERAAPSRATPGVIFQTGEVFARRLGEFSVTTNQTFELLFLVDSILPTYAAMLMLFFGVIRRDLEADEMQTLTPAPADWETHFPFQLSPDPTDDETIAALKQFFAALRIAYGLDVSLSLDA
ncbi:MAG: hypothetical protein ACYDBJ_19375 [Aggregatilineales bacterium]